MLIEFLQSANGCDATQSKQLQKYNKAERSVCVTVRMRPLQFHSFELALRRIKDTHIHTQNKCTSKANLHNQSF